MTKTAFTTSIILLMVPILSFSQSFTDNLSVEKEHPSIRLTNTSSDVYSKSILKFENSASMSGQYFWLFNELGSDNLSKLMVRRLGGGEFLNYLWFEENSNDIRIFPSKSSNAAYGNLVMNNGHFRVEKGNINIAQGKLNVFDDVNSEIKIQGTGGSPSWRARLLLDRTDDFRGAGVWIKASAGSESDWYAGVPYTGAGYTIGYHSTQPHYDENSKFFVNPNGNVGIGTTSPDHELTVKGTVHAEEVLVDLNVPGPDYVFEEDYPLQDLLSLEQYLKANKHLPEVPSAAEMEEEGIKVGEMEMLLLKKVEELTLHLIELKKENDKLKKENQQLSTGYTDVLKRIETLETKLK